jgi:hypothetical protein
MTWRIEWPRTNVVRTVFPACSALSFSFVPYTTYPWLATGWIV